MNLLFDYQAFEMQRFGGVSRSFVELSEELNNLGHICKIGIKESNNEYLKESTLVNNLSPQVDRFHKWFGHEQHFHGEYRLKRFIFSTLNYSLTPNKDYSISLLKKSDFDVFHPTFYDSYFLPYLKERPFVLTVHDMMPELFPQYYSRDDSQIIQKKLLCPLATHIHVPSNRTKEDLVNILNISPEKITVIPHGYRQAYSSMDVSSIKNEKPYILYVGTRNAYKNFVPFVHVCSDIIKDYPEIQVVCTGPAFTDNEKRLFSELKIDKNFIHLYVTERELCSLYQHAVAFIYPSLYEGFGMPILEAFANNCPVLLNNASCFPEVAGDAAVYFDLNDEKSDLYDKIIYVYTLSEEERKTLIDRGQKRLLFFSWKESAQKLETVYKMCL